jgi:hypothetical protein
LPGPNYTAVDLWPLTRKTRRAAPAPAIADAPAAQASPVDLIDKVFDRAKEPGGFVALKRLVDRIAEMEKK